MVARESGCSAFKVNVTGDSCLPKYFLRVYVYAAALSDRYVKSSYKITGMLERVIDARRFPGFARAHVELNLIY